MLRNEAERTRHPTHRLKIWEQIAASHEFVMPALAGEERPRTTAANRVIRTSIIMFAVAVTDIAAPDRPMGRIDLEKDGRPPWCF